MYSHEIISQGPWNAAMRHFRESSSVSGLIKIVEIGLTVATRPLQQRRDPIETQLTLPNPMDIYISETSRSDEATNSDMPREQIYCGSLDDFVDTGVARWRNIVKCLGEVSSIEVHLTEERRIVECITQSGLIVATEQPMTEFVRYMASPEEIEAMDQIARQVPAPEAYERTNEGYGFYL